MTDADSQDPGEQLAQDPDSVTTAARLVLGAAALGVDSVRALLGAQDVKRIDLNVQHRPSGAQSATEAVVGLAARGVPAALSVGKRGTELALRGARSTAD